MTNLRFLKYAVLSLSSLVIGMCMTSCSDDDDGVPCTEVTWYEDLDGDGLGNPDSTISACEQPEGFVGNSDDTNDDGTGMSGGTTIVDASFFNSVSLLSFETITSTYTDGSSGEFYQLVFSANPVPSGPFCPRDIDDVAGLGFYDGATNPGFRVFAKELLDDIEADGYDMVNDDGTVNVDFFDEATDDAKSYCLEASADDDLVLTFIIPVEPKLADSNQEIAEVEIIGLSLDGVPVNGDPPSAINGPAMMGGGPGGGGPGGGGPGGGASTGQINFPSLDPCGGHHDPSGYYHWHFIPEVMNQVLEANGITEVSCTLIEQTSDVTLFGFAKDGFPIYAYANEPTDLDDCGGRTAVTAEFPEGVYHYVASTTVAANVPKCLKGLAANDTFRFQ